MLMAFDQTMLMALDLKGLKKKRTFKL